jgi:YD repeat-containing protein
MSAATGKTTEVRGIGQHMSDDRDTRSASDRSKRTSILARLRHWAPSLLRIALAVTVFGPLTAFAADVTYVYDENGRVSGVVDATGNAATYSYDSNGNIVSIGRIASGQVHIIGFSPSKGSVGATVTISGTGFSTTASLNTITFNGVAATVTTATASQIIAAVPSGAATGPIAITSPSGTATSSTSFTVTQAQTPVISGFSPASGQAGTSVTINGSNFATTSANNITAFANINAVVGSATATSIVATVPAGATSGRISITTAEGTAFGATDFFVPPATFATGDIGWMGRLSFGVGTTLTLGSANKIGLAIFDGEYGQRVSLNISGASFTSSVTCKVLNPDGSTLTQTSCGSGTFVDAKVLPVTGVYTVVVDPSGSGTGSATLTLYDATDVQGTIVPGGASVSVATTVPGQNARLTFSGTSGQRVSLRISSASFTGSVICGILNPSGATLDSTGCSNGSFIDTQVLASTGTYTVLVDPSGTGTGSATLTLYDVPADVTGTITPGGAAVSITTTVPGQNARLTFSGTSAQRVSLRISSASFTGSVICGILNPSGATLDSTGCGNGSFIDTQVLAATGTYTVLVDPSQNSTGSATLTLYDVPADVTGTITPGGAAVSITTTVPGQNARLTFSGTSGQRVSLRISSVSFTGPLICAILNPNGSTLRSTGCGSSTFIDTEVLATTGTYTVLVDPFQNSTGSATLTLYDVPADVSSSITINGAAATVAIGTPGQNGSVTFSGTSGQTVTVVLTSNSFGIVSITLRKPDGSSLTARSSGSTNFNLQTQTLPAAGTYTVEVNPNSSNTGSIAVAVTNP